MNLALTTYRSMCHKPKPNQTKPNQIGWAKCS